MGLFSFLNRKKKPGNDNQKQSEPTVDIRDYRELIEMAHILTGGNQYAVADIAELVNDCDAFYEAHREWCDEMLEDISVKHDRMLLVFAYWLVGYDTDRKFGGYIDWKEATEDILWHLEQAIANLGYPLDTSQIQFTGEEFTDKALQMIHNAFLAQCYELVGLDIGGDCYHLFIVPADQYESLCALGKAVDFKFFNQFA